MNNGEKGMDWMYKGPSALVNREEYLTGRTVDTALKLLDATEKGETNFSYQDEVEKDLTPLSIFSARSQGPVDVIRKIKEDPLFQIQKQEEERLRELLDNPVRLKKLQEMAKKQQGIAAASSSRVSEKSSKSKRSRINSSSDSSDDDGTDIDKLLAQKLKQLKDPKDILSLSKSSSSKEESRHSEGRYLSSRDRRRSRSRSPRESRPRYNERSRDRRSRSRSDDRDRRYRDEARDQSSSQKGRISSRNARESDKRYGSSSSSVSSSRSSRPEPPPKRKAIDEEERERKLREMMENSKWRDEQRVKNVSKHRDEVQKEEDSMKSKHDTEFIRKQLNVAAATGSVEKRIKANSYNIQRSKTAMDQNFAKR